MEYSRVIPRDLFNESKVLKNLGRLTLLCLDGMGLGINYEHEGGSFDIRQNQSSGDLFCSNIRFFHKRTGDTIYFYHRYNSKEPYTMFFEMEDGEEVEVFDNEGNFTEEFKNYIENL